MGRPNKPKGEKLSATVICKLLPDEHKRALAASKAAGMTLSAWTRKLIDDNAPVK